MSSKAELDADDEGGEPVLDENYPPWGEPLYWEEFKAWAKDNLPDYSLAVSLEQVDCGRTSVLPSGTHRSSLRHAWR
jgi:hypothetical protein